MANTIPAGLLADIVTEKTITVLQNKLASLAAYSSDFSLDPMAPLATMQIRKATAGGAAQENPTNFETGDTTLVAMPVTVNHISKSFHITSAELNSGHKLQNLININSAIFADAIQAKINALLVNGNFSIAKTEAAAGFDSSDATELWGVLEKANIKNLILSGPYYAKLMPTDRDGFSVSANGGNPGLLGYDGVWHNSNWAGGQANLVGLVCDPQAIGVGSGIPLMGSAVSQLVDSQIITIPGLNLSVQWNYWGSTSSRNDWMSLDVMFGAGVLDPTAGRLITSA